MTTQHTMQMYARNSSYVIPGVYDIEMHDAGWILVASIMIFRCANENLINIPLEFHLPVIAAPITTFFIVLTVSMQTGFGLLESGIVSRKNEVNIMMKNVVDVVLGGFTYWLFGYGLSFGRSAYTTPFIAFGDFMVDPNVHDELMGQMFTAFFFQLSFATTATTILSGTVAERINFHAYCLFSLINTIVYCVPAGWVSQLVGNY